MQHTRKSSMPPRTRAAKSRAPAARPGLPRFLNVGRANDAKESEADSLVAKAMSGEAPESSRQTDTPAARAPLGNALSSNGRPLDADTRNFMESRFGTSLAHVRVHTGKQSGLLNQDLGARAFAQGPDIFFGEGQTPGRDELTAHEIAHVMQQDQGDASIIRRDLDATLHAPEGAFILDFRTRNDAATGGRSGLDGYIRFVPGPGAENSNCISFMQVARTVDAETGGMRVPESMGSLQAAGDIGGERGTVTTSHGEVIGNASMDVVSNPMGEDGERHAIGRGGVLSPSYDARPTVPGDPSYFEDTHTPQPAEYGGLTGGIGGHIPGFKRSPDPADIRSAAMYDYPGTTGAANVDYDFESVAMAEDTGHVYGSVTWGFQLRGGRVQNEYRSLSELPSPTFDEALERHRDFYAHESVTLYFDASSAELSPTAIARVNEAVDYLSTHRGVVVTIEGYADVMGTHEQSELRAEAVRAELLAQGVDESRIVSMAHGPSSEATDDGRSSDQGGDPALTADPTREANRWANRRVVLSFGHLDTPESDWVPASGR